VSRPLLYTYAGKDIPVTPWQAQVLQQLDQARASVLSGATLGVAIVEQSDHADSYRSWYVCGDEEAMVNLLHRSAELQVLMRNSLFSQRGTVPAANQSKMVN
jgi:hypothetical protein